MTAKNTGAPFLTTDRLELWLPEASDLADMVALMAPEAVREHLGPASPDEPAQFARLLRNAGSWNLYGYGTFMVRLRGESGIIGNCGLFHTLRGFGNGLDDVAEAGWIVAIDHWGKGIAGEAMRAAFAWFDAAHGTRRTACMIETENAVSHRLARMLGFTAYGREILKEDGAEVVLYERLPG